MGRRKPTVINRVTEQVSSDEAEYISDDEDTKPKKSSRSTRGKTNGKAKLPEGTVMVEPESPSDEASDSEDDRKTKKKTAKSNGAGELPAELPQCTACARKLHPDRPRHMCEHPMLGVLICKRCLEYYTSDDFGKDEDGFDEQCRWCGEGGQLLICDYCTHAFCKPCVKRNIGRSALYDLVNAPDDVKWKCYVCRPSPLRKLQQECRDILHAVRTKREEKKRAKHSKTAQIYHLSNIRDTADKFQKIQDAVVGDLKALLEKVDVLEKRAGEISVNKFNLKKQKLATKLEDLTKLVRNGAMMLKLTKTTEPDPLGKLEEVKPKDLKIRSSVDLNPDLEESTLPESEDDLPESMEITVDVHRSPGSGKKVVKTDTKNESMDYSDSVKSDKPAENGVTLSDEEFIVSKNKDKSPRKKRKEERTDDIIELSDQKSTSDSMEDFVQMSKNEPDPLTKEEESEEDVDSSEENVKSKSKGKVEARKLSPTKKNKPNSASVDNIDSSDDSDFQEEKVKKKKKVKSRAADESDSENEREKSKKRKVPESDSEEESKTPKKSTNKSSKKSRKESSKEEESGPEECERKAPRKRDTPSKKTPRKSSEKKKQKEISSEDEEPESNEEKTTKKTNKTTKKSQEVFLDSDRSSSSDSDTPPVSSIKIEDYDLKPLCVKLVRCDKGAENSESDSTSLAGNSSRLSTTSSSTTSRAKDEKPKSSDTEISKDDTASTSGKKSKKKKKKNLGNVEDETEKGSDDLQILIGRAMEGLDQSMEDEDPAEEATEKAKLTEAKKEESEEEKDEEEDEDASKKTRKSKSLESKKMKMKIGPKSSKLRSKSRKVEQKEVDSSNEKEDEEVEEEVSDEEGKGSGEDSGIEDAKATRRTSRRPKKVEGDAEPKADSDTDEESEKDEKTADKCRKPRKDTKKRDEDDDESENEKAEKEVGKSKKTSKKSEESSSENQCKEKTKKSQAKGEEKDDIEEEKEEEEEEDSSKKTRRKTSKISKDEKQKEESQTKSSKQKKKEAKEGKTEDKSESTEETIEEEDNEKALNDLEAMMEEDVDMDSMDSDNAGGLDEDLPEIEEKTDRAEEEKNEAGDVVDDADETKAKEELELMMMDCEEIDEEEDAVVDGVQDSAEEEEEEDDNKTALKDLKAMMMEEGVDEADSEPEEDNDSGKEKQKTKKLSKKETKSPKKEEKLAKKKSPLKKRKSDEKKKRNDSSSSSSSSEDFDEDADRPRKKKLKKKVKKETSKSKEKSTKVKKERESSDSSDFESLIKKSKPSKPGPKCSKKDDTNTSKEDLKKSKEKKKSDKKDDSESDLDKEIKKLTSKLRVGSAKKAQDSDEDSSDDSSDAGKETKKKDSGKASGRGKKKADSDSDVVLEEEAMSEESEESEDEEEESNTAKLLKELGGKVDSKKKKKVESDEDLSDLDSDSDDKPKSKKGKGAKSKKTSEDSESSAVSKKKKKEQFGKELLRGKLSESDSESGSKKRKSKRGKKDSDSDVVLSDSESGAAKKKKKRKRAAKSSTSDSESGPGKKKRRRRIRAMSDSSVASDEDDRPKQKRKKKGEQAASEEEGEDAPGSAHKRKHIRKIMSDKKLDADTKAAAQEEEERRKRVEDRQKRYNEMHIDTEIGENKVPITTKLVLEFDESEDEENSEEDGLEIREEKPKKKKKKKGEESEEEEKEEEEDGEKKKGKKPLIQVDKWLIRNLKPHQVEAVKFMWNCTIESLEQIKKGEGSGCILAHCMGLGKTLSVITLVHTVLRHRELLGLKTCMVICPLNTVLNWQNEWAKWFEEHDEDDKVNVFEMSQHKTHHQRLACLKDWQHSGGVCIIGYEMFRNLAKGNHMRSKKMKASFAECLLNPGPDMVVCDEGHILKNCESGLSKITSEIKTLRRIVLTGTPLQNNLGEYHCMVSFVKPRLLGTKKEFYNRFIAPIINGSCADSTSRDVRIMKKRAHVLHEMLNGCVQRRDYSALTPYLPPKFEYVVSVRLSPRQMDLYQRYLDRKEEEVTVAGSAGARLFKDFQALMRIWTHPWVIRMHHVRVLEQRAKQELEESDEDFLDDAESSEAESSKTDTSDTSDDGDKSGSEKAVKPSARSNRLSRRSRRGRRGSGEGSDEEIVSKWKTTTRSGVEGALNGDDEKPEEEEEKDKEWWTDMVKDEDEKSLEVSGKLVILFEILKKAEEIGDKVLVFSQSLLSLDIIERFLEVVDSAPNALTALNGEEDGEPAKGMGCTWVKGADYFRLDGSTNAFNRQKFCDVFNDYENPRARLFLISTRAGSLGINLVHANRVVVFDASWNPTYDVQSMFRVYRFGQLKPVYVYRLVAQGTMEEKIYERQVTKQSLSQRVVDEHQIDRHFNTQDLAELYRFDPDRLDDPNRKERPTPALPKDLFLADLLKEQSDWIVGYHEHDSLLENQVDQELTEEERKAAWEEYEAEKKGLITNPPPYMNQGGMSATDWLSHYGQRGASSLPNYTNPMISQMLMPPDSFLQEVSRQLLRQNPDMPPGEVMQRARGYWIRNLQVQELQKQQMLAAQQQELIRLHQMRQQQRLMEHQRLQQAQQEAAARGKPSILKSRTSEGATMRSLLTDNQETHVIPDD